MSQRNRSRTIKLGKDAMHGGVNGRQGSRCRDRLRGSSSDGLCVVGGHAEFMCYTIVLTPAIQVIRRRAR